jgi:hypothetical protein
MAVAIQRTARGHPRPGSGSTGAQARRAELPQSDGLCPHPLRLPPEEHVMTPHQDHPNGASEPVSQPPLTRRSLLLCWRLEHLHLPPVRCHICTCTNKQQTIRSVSIHQNHVHQYINIININHKNKNTSYTSMIECLPRRQHNVGVPPEVHSRIWEPGDELRRLPPDLRCLL